MTAVPVILPSLAIPALSINWQLSYVFTKTISSNSTFTFANVTDGQVIIVVITAGAGNTVTWPTVKWPGGTPPVQTSSGTDSYTFFAVGSTVYGIYGQGMA